MSMTENEAKVLLCQMYLPQFDEEEKQALTMAIQAIDKVLQFEAIGTIDEFKALKEKEERFDRNIKMFNEIGLEIRVKAIDEFAELLKGNLIRKYANATLTQQYVALQVTDWCNEIAEQMKAGAE